MDKCFNIDCEDNDAEAENGCYFDDTSNCIGFVSKKQWKEKMTSLGLGKLSDLEYGCMPERNNNMDDVKKGAPPNSISGTRMNARSVLQDKIEKCEKELNALKTLGHSIEWEILSPQQEELLWYYFSTNR